MKTEQNLNLQINNADIFVRQADNRKALKDLFTLIKDSDLVFNLRLTNLKINDIPQVICLTGTYVPKTTTSGLYNNLDHITLKLIAVWRVWQGPTINVLSDSVIPFFVWHPKVDVSTGIETAKVIPPLDQETLRYFPILNKKVRLGDEEYSLRLRQFGLSDITSLTRYLDSEYVDSLLYNKGRNQFFIASDTDWDTLKHYFLVNKLLLSGGNSTMRQWLSDQDYELSIFVNCLQLSKLNAESLYSQSKLIQATYSSFIKK